MNPLISNLYVKTNGEGVLILVVYVDDLIIGNNDVLVKQVKKLQSTSEMIDSGLMHYFLGVEVWENGENIYLFHRESMQMSYFIGF